MDSTAPSFLEGTRSAPTILADSPENSTFRRSPLERGPGPVDPPLEDHLQRLPALFEALADERTLVPLEGLEDEVRSVPTRGERPDADPDAWELVGPDLAGDRDHALVRAGPALLPDPDLSERDVEVVVDHDQALRRNVLPAHGRPHGEPAPVHEGLGQGQEDFLPAPAGEAGSSLEQPPPELDVPGPGQALDQAEAGVVARGRVLVTRIAQPPDQPHALFLRLFFLCPFLLDDLRLLC